MSIPVNAEIWTLLEGSLQQQAKRLVEDIAKRQKADPKVLWAKVKPQLRVTLQDVDLPDPIPQYCSFNTGSIEGGIYTRCRHPCVLGHSTCFQHTAKAQAKEKENLPLVHRVFDHQSHTYFVDKEGIAYDKNGTPVGTVEEETLLLFATKEG